jgi:hypothetical protein
MQMHVSEGAQKRGLNSVRRCNGKKVRTCAWKDQKRNDPIVRPKSDKHHIDSCLMNSKYWLELALTEEKLSSPSLIICCAVWRGGELLC